MRDTTLYDLFIVYATDDLEWVEGSLIPALGISSERILTQELVRPGAEKVTEFERAVTSSRYTLLILSPAFLADTWTMYIASLASYSRVYSERDRLLPLRLKPCHIPLWIDALKLSFDCTVQSHRNAEIARLRQVLNQPEPPSLPRPCPYPGMRPFREDESHYFFGRDRDIQTLLDHLHNFPFVTIIGTSGSGKSSLVFAGLIPALKDGKLYQTQHWRICSMRPGETPFTTLQNLLGSDLSNPKDAVKNTLFIPPGAQKLLIVVDQFEELFILSESKEEEINRFQEILQHLIKIPDCLVVLTVRMDFYADLTRYPLLWKEIQQHRQEIVPLDHAGLRDAILKPAEQVGVFVETALVERLVADAAGEPGVLPLVQETLSLLWQGLERRFLPLHAYETLSRSNEVFGVPNEGQLTGLQVAIARHADTTLNTLNETQQQIARRIFLRLVHFGEGRPDTRRQQPVKALHSTVGSPQEFNHTLEQLTVHRLLTRSGEEQTDEGYVDIAHDALIDGWPTLKDWIQKWKEAEQVKRRLEEKVAEWERLDRKGSLLDEKTFPEAEAWIHGPDAIILGYRSNLIEFIEDSRKAIERRRKSLRNWLILVTVIAIVAIGAAFGAYYGFRQATVNEELANQQKEVAEQERDRANQERDIAQRQTLEALNQNSKSLFLSKENDLNALIAGIKAVKFAKQILHILPYLKNTAILNLREIVEGIYEKNWLIAHEDSVYALTFSPDGKILASGCAGYPGKIKLWNVEYGFEITTFKEHHNHTVSSLAFSPDGKVLASGSIDGTIKFWDIKRGITIQTMDECRSVYSIDFNADGTELAFACDNAVKLFILNNNETRTLQELTSRVTSVDFSPDGRRLAASTDTLIILWNVMKASETARLQGHDRGITSISFNKDGTILASGGWDKTIKLWDVEKNINIKTFQVNYDVQNVNFSPDGKILVSSGTYSDSDGIAHFGDNRTIHLWDVSSGSEITALPGHAFSVNIVRFSPNNKLLASGNDDGHIKLWTIKDKEPFKTFPVCSDTVLDIAISPNGEMLASGNFDERIMKIWKAMGNNTDSPFIAETDPDGRPLLLHDFNYKGIKLWNITNGTEFTVLQGHAQQRVFSLQFSPDGKILASSGDDRIIRLWNTQTGDELATLQGYAERVTCLAFSPDGKLLASAGDPPGHTFHSVPEGYKNEAGEIITENSINVWDITNGSNFKILKGTHHFINALAFSPDGRILVSANDDNMITFWNIAEGEKIRTLSVHTGSVSNLEFHPDGTMFAASTGREIKLWSVAKGTELRTFEGHSSGITSIAFSPGGTMLASGSSDYTIKLWDVLTGKELTTLQGHSNSIIKILFSPNGKKLISRSWDKTIKVWDLDAETLVLRGCERVLGYLKTSSGVNEEERSLCDDIALMKLGKYYCAIGRFDEAKTAYQTLLQENPRHHDAWSQMGQTLLEQHEFDRAIEAFRKQLEIVPDHDDAWYRMGMSFKLQGKPDKAIAPFQKQLECNPKHKEALEELQGLLEKQEGLAKILTQYQQQAERLEKQGQLVEAIKNYQILLTLQPEHTTAWNSLGVLLSQREEFEEAIRAFQKQLEVQPDHDWAWNNLGDALKKQRNFEEAIAAYQQQLALNPNHEIAWNNLGLVLWQQDSYEKAIRRAKAAHNTEEPLKQQLLQQDKLEEAMAAFQKQVEVNPDCDEAWDNIRRMLREQNRTEEILAVYQKQVEANPSHQNAWRLLGMELKRQGKMNEAIKAYQKQVEINPGDDTTWTVLGSELWNNNRKDEAASAYAHAIQLRPKDVKLLHNDAKLALIQGDRGRCQKRIAEALPLITTEDSDLSVNLLFFQWLAEPEQDFQHVITAIEKLPSKTEFRGNFSTLIPVIERQPPPTQKIARSFIEFFENKIDLPTLKGRIGEVNH